MYPSISEYLSAIKDSSENLDKLAHLKPVLDIQGEPYRSVGGFAVVFKMQDEETGRLYAIKCFHEEQDDRAESYMEIGKALRSNKSSYVMDVNYLAKEIFVDTKLSDETEFPVLQMDWIEGETMETYITSHYRDTDAIRQLYLKFCDLALWLRTKPFAHGDIKPDNIMIKPDGNLTLVDYDGMFVPALKGRLSPTIGTKSFSHPQRTPQHFDEHIDDFSLASISISLLAMSEDPTLYKDYAALDRLLFSDSDYRDLENSEIYKKLRSMGGVFPKLLELFHECLSTYEGHQSSYDQIFDLQTKAPEIIYFTNATGDTVYAEDEINLKWEVTNATQLTINGKDVSEESCFRDKPTNTIEYVLKASNGLKESLSKRKILVIPKPRIVFRADKLKLRKGKERKVRIYWDVQNATTANLNYMGKDVNIHLHGEKILDIDSYSEIKISVVGLDEKKTFTKSLKIYVFTESKVSFVADKVYSMPNIPIKLSWNVQHAKEIELLNFGKVDAEGQIVVSPSETTTYVLKVTDAFGPHDYNLKIQMLPLPIISLKIPTPQFVSNTEITVNTPPPPVLPSIPNINVMGVELNAPQIPDLEESGFQVELSALNSRQIKFWSDVKSLYSFYKNKFKKHIHYEGK